MDAGPEMVLGIIPITGDGHLSVPTPEPRE